MSDNARLRTILELFHTARREKQIHDRLKAAANVHYDNLRAISEAMCLYSPWKFKDVLVKDGTLWIIDEVGFVHPELEDMKPKFSYVASEVKGVDESEALGNSGVLSTGDNRVWIKPDTVRYYRLATTEEIKALPVIKIRKARAKKI